MGALCFTFTMDDFTKTPKIVAHVADVVRKMDLIQSSDYNLFELDLRT